MMREFNDGTRKTLIEGVVEAVNKIDNPEAKVKMIASLRECVPRVRWFTNHRGIVDAVAAD